jgi:thiamine biosynthesis lipoprotein
MIAGVAPATASPAADERLIRFEARAMASPLRLTLASRRGPTSFRRATAAWIAVLQEFEACEQAMSRFRDSSEITMLNRRAGRDAPTAASHRLTRALMACDRAVRMTEGRFDPRVIVDLERLGDRGAPIGKPIRSEADRTPRGRIVQRDTGGHIRLPEPVDLGGIGKGLALRWAATTIRRSGFDAFLCEAGGDIVASGEPPDGGPWRVGIEDPVGGPEPLAVVAASGRALVTSSVRRRRWAIGDRIVHHLIDPRTGEPGGAGLRAVTVAGGDPAWAEVWSKSLFLEGRSGIAALARRRGLAAWWVAEDGSLEMTAGARLQTLWTRSESG